MLVPSIAKLGINQICVVSLEDTMKLSLVDNVGDKDSNNYPVTRPR